MNTFQLVNMIDYLRCLKQSWSKFSDARTVNGTIFTNIFVEYSGLMFCKLSLKH